MQWLDQLQLLVVELHSNCWIWCRLCNRLREINLMSSLRVNKIIDEVGTGPVEFTKGVTFPVWKKSIPVEI